MDAAEWPFGCRPDFSGLKCGSSIHGIGGRSVEDPFRARRGYLSAIRSTSRRDGSLPARQRLAGWAETGVLARVHAILVGMLRGHPDLILDICMACAKRAGALTGLNPTDRAKRGTTYHVAGRAGDRHLSGVIESDRSTTAEQSNL
jgi:hypothetical protein